MWRSSAATSQACETRLAPRLSNSASTSSVSSLRWEFTQMAGRAAEPRPRARCQGAYRRASEAGAKVSVEERSETEVDRARHDAGLDARRNEGHQAQEGEHPDQIASRSDLSSGAAAATVMLPQ